MEDATHSDTILVDSHHSRADMALVRRAINGGWNVPQKLKRRVLKKMRNIVALSPDERNVIGAAKVILAADAIDISMEKIAQKNTGGAPNNHLHLHGSADEKRTMLAALAARIGTH